MIKSILVCTDGSSAGDAARDYGIYLAKTLKAHLKGLHVLDARTLDGPLMATVSGWVGALPYNIELMQFRELLQQKGNTIIEAFNARCREEGIDAETIVSMGYPARVIIEEEINADILILGQKGEHAAWLGESAGSTVSRVVRHSAKPVLVTPVTFTPIRKILAAYDGSDHATQAVREAATLAAALQVPLEVLTVAPTRDTEEANRMSREGMNIAIPIHKQVSHLVGSGEPHVVIMGMAEHYNFDLIVAGAFGHSRIREMIIGSTTQQMIMRSTVPVMLIR